MRTRACTPACVRVCVRVRGCAKAGVHQVKGGQPHGLISSVVMNTTTGMVFEVLLGVCVCTCVRVCVRACCVTRRVSD